MTELLGAGARHPLLLRTAFSASTNFRGPGYYEDAAVKLNVAFTMASELYDADSVPVARAIYSRALLMRDLGDLTEASRLLPQVSHPPRIYLPLIPPHNPTSLPYPLISPLISPSLPSYLPPLSLLIPYSLYASRLQLQALKLVKDRVGMKSVLFGEILGDVGEALRLEGKYDPAALALNQALQLRKTYCGAEHYLVGETLISQGLLLLDQNKAEEALRIIDTDAVPLLMKCFGPKHPHTMYAKGTVTNNTNDQ